MNTTETKDDKIETCPHENGIMKQKRKKESLVLFIGRRRLVLNQLKHFLFFFCFFMVVQEHKVETKHTVTSIARAMWWWGLERGLDSSEIDWQQYLETEKLKSGRAKNHMWIQKASNWNSRWDDIEPASMNRRTSFINGLWRWHSLITSTTLPWNFAFHENKTILISYWT